MLTKHLKLSSVLTLGVFFLLSLLFSKRANDFQTFYDIGSLARLHRDIYQPAPSTGMYVFYFPFFSLLMLPWSFLPVKMASVAFIFLNFLLTVFFFWDFSKTFQVDSRKRKLFFIVAVLSTLPFLIKNQALGQVNILIALLIWLGLRFFCAVQRICSALCFALASFKVIPLILFVFILLSKDWRFILSYCASLSLLIIAPLLYFGLDTGIQQWHQFFALAYHHKIAFKEIRSYPIQSLWGAISRLFPFLAESALPFMITGLFLMFLAVTFWKYGTGKGLRDNLSCYRLAAILCTAMLLFSPDARSSHFCILVLPVLLIVRDAMLDERWGPARILSVLILVVNVFYSADLVGRKVYGMAQGLSLYTGLMLAFVFYFFSQNESSKEENF